MSKERAGRLEWRESRDDGGERNIEGREEGGEKGRRKDKEERGRRERRETGQ